MVDSEERQGELWAIGRVLQQLPDNSGMLCVSKERIKETESRRVSTQRDSGVDSARSELF